MEHPLGIRELTGASSHDLVRWLLARGADEFSLRIMALQDVQAPFVDAFEDEFAPHERTMTRRPVIDPERYQECVALMPRVVDASTTVVTGAENVRLWSLNARTVPLLLGFCDDGILEWPVGPDGWFEDLMIYRDGSLVLGLLSDARAGVLRVTEDEYATFVRDGV